MRRRRATSSTQNKSSRVPSPPSCSSWDEGADHTFDDAPDELPVRDVRDDVGEPRSVREVDSESLAAPERQADGPVAYSDNNSTAREALKNPLPLRTHDERLAHDPPLPKRPSEAEAGELHPQHQLPGLVPDATASPRGTSARGGRSGRRQSRSQKLALKAAQLELWPEPDGPMSGE